MKRIKNLEGIILQENEVLMEVFYEESLILKPDQSKEKDFDHAVVMAVGNSVKDLVKGDIVLQGQGGLAYKIGDRTIMFIPRFGIKVAIKPDNFNNTRLVSKSKLLN